MRLTFAMLFSLATLSGAGAQGQKLGRDLQCVVSTAIIYVREADRETTGFTIREDTQLFVSDCESDNLGIVHWPIFGEPKPAFIDSRDLRLCSDARFTSREFAKRAFTPIPYKNYTRPSIR